MPLSIDSVIKQLTELIYRPERLASEIPELQKKIWKEAESVNVDKRWEILFDLAYDLEYFQPDQKIRAKDESLRDEAWALNEIRQAITALAK